MRAIRMFRYWQYNKRHHTYINSLDSSLRANYGEGVMVSRGVVISQDVSIGKYSYVNPRTTLENCTIGNYCSISADLNVCPGAHDLYALSTHPRFERKDRKKREPVIIGHDVLISLKVVVLSGVHIGNGAVIGAGSVVTKDVFPYEIVAGVPAKHIGWRFDTDTIKWIENTEWWKEEPDRIKEIQAQMFKHNNIID